MKIVEQIKNNIKISEISLSVIKQQTLAIKGDKQRKAKSDFAEVESINCKSL